MTTLKSLGGLYFSMERYNNALKNYEECMPIIVKELGKNHFHYINLLNNIVSVQIEMGMYESALKNNEE